MIEAKQTYCGQRVRYGDFFRVWDVHTDLPEEDAIKWCFKHLYNNCVVPPIQEWKANIRYGAPKFNDAGYYFAGYYFAGYYSTRKFEGGFEFTICEPYAD